MSKGALLFPNNQTVTDYSYKGFQSINPENIKEIKKARYLNLAGNNIIDLPLKLTKLEGLSLAYNNIELLSLSIVERFQCYQKLKNLDLSHNSLSTFNDNLSKLKGLERLFLSGNQLNSVKLSNRKLSVLDLSSNLFRSYPEMLPPSLSILNLASNSIKLISPITSNIVELRLQMNELTSICEGAYFPNLKILDISKNNIQTLPNVAKIAPSLTSFNGSSNLMTVLPTLPPGIVEIHMSHNQIETVDNLNTLYPKLECLNLSHNQLKVMTTLPSSLVSLFLSCNQLRSLLPSKLPKLDLLQLSHNELAEFPNYVMKNVSTIDLSNNLFTQIPPNLPKSLNILDMCNNYVNQIGNEIFKLPNLSILLLTNNKIETIPESIQQSNLTHLNVSMNLLTQLPSLPASIRKLIASNNGLTSIPQSYSDLSSLHEIYISNNQISDIPALPYIHRVRASCNKLAKFPAGLSSIVRIIDLSFNHISELPELTQFPELIDLDISHNRIATIPQSIQSCTNLLYLNLGFNDIQTPINLESLTKLATLNIAGNGISNVSCCPSMRNYISTTDEASPIKTKVFDNDLKTVAFAEMTGQRKQMEDSILLTHNNDIFGFAVYDGHCGDALSRFASFELYEAINSSEEISTAFIEKTLQISNEYLRGKHLKSGSTLAISLLQGNKLICSNVGDARILIIDNHGNIQFQTVDHKPNERKEFERIKNEGGYIASNDRINGVLAVSRALGDFRFKGVSCKPDTTQMTLTDNLKWLIIGCDGIFEKLSNEEIAKLAVQTHSADKLSYLLRNTAYGAGSQDNLSVIAINLQQFIHLEK